MAAVLEQARSLPQLHSVIVARQGRTLVEERIRGASLDEPVNIKSASKTIIGALVGRAISEGLLQGLDQPIAPLLAADVPEDADPRLQRVTIGNLLSMQSGLERTSGANYGRWVGSSNWVRFILSRPFADEPGGRMLYSTGNTHLLSAILTQVSGRSTRELFTEWLAEPLGIRVGAWERDPQGVYLGGNNMALSPRALLRFGEMMRNDGMVNEKRVLPPEWIDTSWTPRTRSDLSGALYGLGWFVTTFNGHAVVYAWGFGGQMLYIVPDLELTIVMTSDIGTPSARTGYVDELHRLVAEGIIPQRTRRPTEAESGRCDGSGRARLLPLREKVAHRVSEGSDEGASQD